MLQNPIFSSHIACAGVTTELVILSYFINKHLYTPWQGTIQERALEMEVAVPPQPPQCECHCAPASCRQLTPGYPGIGSLGLLEVFAALISRAVFVVLSSQLSVFQIEAFASTEQWYSPTYKTPWCRHLVTQLWHRAGALTVFVLR